MIMEHIYIYIYMTYSELKRLKYMHAEITMHAHKPQIVSNEWSTFRYLGHKMNMKMESQLGLWATKIMINFWAQMVKGMWLMSQTKYIYIYIYLYIYLIVVLLKVMRWEWDTKYKADRSYACVSWGTMDVNIRTTMMFSLNYRGLAWLINTFTLQTSLHATW